MESSPNDQPTPRQTHGLSSSEPQGDLPMPPLERAPLTESASMPRSSDASVQQPQQPAHMHSQSLLSNLPAQTPADSLTSLASLATDPSLADKSLPSSQAEPASALVESPHVAQWPAQPAAATTGLYTVVLGSDISLGGDKKGRKKGKKNGLSSAQRGRLPMSFKRHRNRRRAIEEIDDREVWKCPFGCGKMYKRTSTVSIRTHNERCVFRLTAVAEPGMLTRSAVESDETHTSHARRMMIDEDSSIPPMRKSKRKYDSDDEDFYPFPVSQRKRQPRALASPTAPAAPSSEPRRARKRPRKDDLSADSLIVKQENQSPVAHSSGSASASSSSASASAATPAMMSPFWPGMMVNPVMNGMNGLSAFGGADPNLVAAFQQGIRAQAAAQAQHVQQQSPPMLSASAFPSSGPAFTLFHGFNQQQTAPGSPQLAAQNHLAALAATAAASASAAAPAVPAAESMKTEPRDGDTVMSDGSKAPAQEQQQQQAVMWSMANMANQMQMQAQAAMNQMQAAAAMSAMAMRNMQLAAQAGALPPGALPMLQPVVPTLSPFSAMHLLPTLQLGMNNAITANAAQTQQMQASLQQQFLAQQQQMQLQQAMAASSSPAHSDSVAPSTSPASAVQLKLEAPRSPEHARPASPQQLQQSQRPRTPPVLIVSSPPQKPRDAPSPAEAHLASVLAGMTRPSQLNNEDSAHLKAPLIPAPQPQQQQAGKHLPTDSDMDSEMPPAALHRYTTSPSTRAVLAH